MLIKRRVEVITFVMTFVILRKWLAKWLAKIRDRVLVERPINSRRNLISTLQVR